MAAMIGQRVKIGPPHVLADAIQTQVYRNEQEHDPQKAFSLEIDAPGLRKTVPINNGAALEIPIHPVTVHLEIDDFRLVPPNATVQNATAIAFRIVAKAEAFVPLTIATVDVTASLK
jgi:hypothetical protein